jgi:heat shock protein HslJ
MNAKHSCIILLIFVAFIGGCGSEQGTVESLTVITSENLSGIVDVQWMLEEMTIDGDKFQLTGERPLVKFERDGKVSGFASVNRFFGSMQIDDAGKVKWSNAFGSTRMAGPPERMEQESVFLEMLAKTDQLSIKGERLYAQSPEGRTKLVFYVSVE